LKRNLYCFIILVLCNVLLTYGQDSQNAIPDSTSPPPEIIITRQIRFYGGISIPLGKFSSTNTSDNEAGFATIGPLFGMDMDFDITNYIAYVLGFTVSFNKVNFDPIIEGTGISAEVGSYTSIWILNGVMYSKPVSENMKFHFQGQVGLLFGYIPEVFLTKGSSHGKIPSAISSSFAFSFGVGIDMGHIVVTMRYFSGTPEYADVNQKKFNQPTWCIVPCIGIVF
jgi:hypothetical protein